MLTLVQDILDVGVIPEPHKIIELAIGVSVDVHETVAPQALVPENTGIPVTISVEGPHMLIEQTFESVDESQEPESHQVSFPPQKLTRILMFGYEIQEINEAVVITPMDVDEPQGSIEQIHEIAGEVQCIGVLQVRRYLMT